MINAPARKLTPTSYFADVARAALYVVPSSTGNVTLTPAAATLTFTGATPTVDAGANQSVSPAAASLAFTGATPTITVSNHQSASPTAAALIFTMSRPVIYINGIAQGISRTIVSSRVQSPIGDIVVEPVVS